jgi:uncharacterized protein
MAIKRRIVLVVVVVFLLGFFSYFSYQSYLDASYQVIEVGFNNGSKIDAYLADNSKKQRIGLAAFNEIEDGQGMIFVYPDSQVRSVWMKDMDFDIDVIWLDRDKKIVKIEENIPVESYPNSYSSEKPVKYFIEVNAGWVENNKISLGGNVVF